MSYFVLGNWSRANFGFACHDRLLVAPFRFKTMDEYFSLSNEEVAQFPSLVRFGRNSFWLSLDHLDSLGQNCHRV
jgi:hypothetical protein